MENTEKIAAIREWLGAGSINIFGRQFAGKDTHGRELVALFDGVLLGAGDIFRNSVIPQHAKAEMDAGRLVPINDFIEIVLPYLSKEEFKNSPLILSSVGRWHGEEQGVVQATKEAGHPLKAVIYLDIAESVSFERWKKSLHIGERNERNDEDREALETRLAEYKEKTLPVINFYKQDGLLIEIDGTLSKEVVLQDIIDALYIRSTR
ncbi:MAG: nucleoside monophosphate kinase [Patescibacteria group bacterium]